MKRFSDSELDELEYPDETLGSIAAREIREECNRLTRREREELFREGLALICSADVTQVVPQIVPERFTSITKAQRDPIVSPELTSITRTNDLDGYESVKEIVGLVDRDGTYAL